MSVAVRGSRHLRSPFKVIQTRSVMSNKTSDKAKQVSIPTFKLNNGRKIPALGYGTWLGLDEKDILNTNDIPRLVDAMSYAIDIGYRHIDTAHVYRVEPEVGQVINKKIREGVVKREEMFVTSKVWQLFHREADVEKSVRGSLKRLNLDYLDLALVHWPMSFDKEGVDLKIDYLETWRGFETVLKKGLVKGIGVSNFNIQQLERLLKNCKVPPVCNQIEINLNHGSNDLVEYCQRNNILVVAYSPFGTMIPSRNQPDSPEPKLDNPTLVAIGKKHGKTPTQIALRYLYQRNITSIPKTLTKSRVLENASIFDFQLDSSDVSELVKFDNGYRTVNFPYFRKYTNFPFDGKTDDNVEVPLAFRKWKNGINQDIE